MNKINVIPNEIKRPPVFQSIALEIIPRVNSAKNSMKFCLPVGFIAKRRVPQTANVNTSSDAISTVMTFVQLPYNV